MAQPRVAVVRSHDVPVERLHRYWEALHNAGIEPLDYTEPGQSLADCAGLLLCGGIDIDPARYGEAGDPSVDNVSPERDDLEAGALRLALTSDLPVLAICRGHQLLNVCLGGSLLQDIPSEEHKWLDAEGSPSSFHDVVVEPDTKLRRHPWRWTGHRQLAPPPGRDARSLGAGATRLGRHGRRTNRGHRERCASLGYRRAVASRA